MTEMPTIICKPTPWFWSRAIGMLVMFTFLGGWFYKDAAVGYKNKNLVFLYDKAFEKVANEYLADKNAGKTDADWAEKAKTATISLGDDAAILPDGSTITAPWPLEMQDPAIISKGPDAAWEAHRARMKWNKPDEKIHAAGAIQEQWYYGYGLTALACYTIFVILRTAGRKISVDATSITTQQGKVVPFSSLYELDLRKWANKGLAIAKYKTADGKLGVVRIDGLTYGGFKTEQNEPAEQLMRVVKENFHGEIIDYESTAAAETPAPPAEADVDEEPEKTPQ